MSPIEAKWVYDAVKRQVAAIKLQPKIPRFSDRPESLPRAALLRVQGAIEKALSM